MSLQAQHIGPITNPSVTVRNDTDLLQRLPAVPAVPSDQLELGIRDCLSAAQRCTAYSICFRQIQTRHIGSFWLDLFNLHREVAITGWTFSALTVFADDLVVYALAGGQPRIDEKQTTRNPVGPLQGLGAALPMPAP